MKRPLAALAALCLGTAAAAEDPLWQRIDPAGPAAKLVPPLPETEDRAGTERTPLPSLAEAPGKGHRYRFGFTAGLRSLDDDWGIDDHGTAGVFVERSFDLPWLRAVRASASYADTEVDRRFFRLESEFPTPSARTINVPLDDPRGVGDTVGDGSTTEVITGDTRRDGDAELYRFSLRALPFVFRPGRGFRLRGMVGLDVVRIDGEYEDETAAGASLGAELSRTFDNGPTVGLRGTVGYLDLDFNHHDGGGTAEAAAFIAWTF